MLLLPPSSRSIKQLYNDDFRSLERTFSLLTQVVGRSGRGEHPGKAVIQTLTPENEIIKLAAKQDYDAFYNTEIRMRKLMIYPPFCDICVVGFQGEDEVKTRVASRARRKIKELTAGEYKDEKLIVLGPLPARVPRVNKKYRYRLIIKCRKHKGIPQYDIGNTQGLLRRQSVLRCVRICRYEPGSNRLTEGGQ